MNGKKYLLDTNAALYILGGEIPLSHLPEGEYAVSVVTELGLLSFSKITSIEELVIGQFLQDIQIIELSEEIKKQTILLRKRLSLKLPEAIIVATAIETDSVLITHDKKLLKIPSLSAIVL
jgi:predicted nucleic acid-binding protein